MGTITTQDPKHVALRKYFSPLPPKPNYAFSILLVVIGVAAFLIVAALRRDLESNGGITTGIVFGIGFIALAAIIAWAQRESYLTARAQLFPQPTDRVVQDWLDEGQKNLIGRSRNQLRIAVDEIVSSGTEPLMITSPILGQRNGIPSRDILWKLGEDKVLRFGIYRIMIVQLTSRHLAVYSCDYNFIRDVPLNEEATEFHYHDVVAVSTHELSSCAYLDTDSKKVQAREFRVSVSSGESMRIAVDVGQIQTITSDETLPESGMETAVSVIRNRLREMKM